MIMPMLLSQLIPGVALKSDIVVSGLTDDSRRVQKGDLYLATPGQKHDGRDFVEQVLETAAAAVCEAPFATERDNVVVLDDLSARKGHIASRFWREPSARLLVVGITGTNGKTSCGHFIAQALTALGQKCGMIGTLGWGFGTGLQEAGLTTPSALDLQRQLAALCEQGAAAVSIETSSHGLVQGRLNGTQINVALFTNISRDHLDYHETFAEYRAAKQKLFTWPGLQAAVINVDDEFGRHLRDLLGSELQVISYSVVDAGATVSCGDVRYSSAGFETQVQTPWGSGLLQSSLLGEFNVSNVLAVISVLGLLGHDFADVLRMAGQLTNVRGRMDALAAPGQPLAVIDYAHTPDALAKALDALRVNCQGQLWCVFGCGGDRDKGKRPEMGRVATGRADHTIVTDDNPRTEMSAAIIADILQGTTADAQLEVEPDRRRAVALALSQARAGDIVLIAGKGHEDYQEIMGQRFHYSDYDQVEQFFNEHKSDELAVHAADRSADKGGNWS
jgi:UDP-N-acetylmuramoyl-L-alanyl-D-glutamate--2,6-diaminopimelate ligase